MKLWIDDERPIPDETWTLAVNADEARQLMSSGEAFEHISLDYTLGYRMSDEQGDDVLKWMLANGVWADTVTAHSSSWAGRELLIEMAKQAGKTVTVWSHW